MRVLILSQFFEPEPLPKTMDLAQGLVARGHSVTVITGFPNYPSGNLYPGYRIRLFARDTVRGIPVLRTALFPSHGTSITGRLANYGSFMLSSVLGAFLTPACDVMYVWHPPLTIGVSAWLIGRLKGIPYVYDVQDIWPDGGVWTGIVRSGGFLVRAMHLLERFVYAKADHLLVVTEGAKRNLMAKGVPERKLSIASQLSDDKLFSRYDPARADEIARRFGFSERFVVMFTGNIGLVQGLDSALAAAGLLQDAHPDVLFAIIGDGTDRGRLMAQSKALGLKSVLFIDHQPMKDIPDFVANAGALLLPLKPSPISELAIPLKTFAYMASGRPIVAALTGAAADLISRAGAGFAVDPENPQALADAILRLKALTAEERAAIGARARAYLVAHHSKERVIDDHVAMLANACHSGTGA